ncbi:MAG: hypothetical protein IT379_18650 [Deltaproteobacteria bacterium]|nr:hypothetical protein [Deltaproteobacteria bacterium]
MSAGRRLRSASIVVAMSATGCALDAGHGFGTIEDATFSAVFVAGAARDLGDSTVLTDLAYHVRIEHAELEVQSVALEELRGAGGAVFDPAHPPPGYTLCHGAAGSGDCHHEDGRVVSYAEVMAELAGGSASFAPVVSFALDARLDLLDGSIVELPEPSPSRELPRATLSRLTVRATALSVRGEVSAGPEVGGLGPRVVPLRIDLPVERPITMGLARPLDRDHERAIQLSVAVTVDGALLDGIELASLAEDPSAPIVIDDPDGAEAERIADALAASDVEVAF